MNIQIRKSEIFAEVEKQSAYVASTVEGGIHFDELWATSHDHEIMDSYWIEGCASAVSLLMRYIRSESVEHNLEQHSKAEVLEFRTDMPDTFNDFLIGSIVSSLKMMLVNGILGSWLSVKYPGVAERYITLSKDYSDDVKSKLLYRNQPYQNRSKHVGEDTDLESVTEQFSKAGADSDIEHVNDFYDTATQDEADKKITEQFSNGVIDVKENPVIEYYKTGAKDNDHETITEQFSKAGTDTADKPIKEVFDTDTPDDQFQEVTEQFSNGQADVKDESVTEYFEKLESDNLILKQYEKCCYHP